MALRLLEMTLPEDRLKAVEEAISGRPEILDVRMQQMTGSWKLPVLGVWKDRFSTNQILIKMLIQAEGSQDLLDLLGERFGQDDGFRINILPVEASLPAVPEKEEKGTEEEPEKKNPERISREELYQDLQEAAKATNIYLVMIVLSSIVAAIGVLNNNVAVIIGAMVIAPMLGPNVALSLATTLGDLPLAKSALRTNLMGILIALSLSVFIGSVLPVDPTLSEIATRTRVGLMDIVLALTSGAAGALSFTTAAPAVLIGVAVAVALLPPLVACGLLLGSGHETLAFGALLLFLVNVICVNLAGVATFLAQGIGPRDWWEAEAAKRATFVAIAVWIVLLLVLILIISQQTSFRIFPFSGS
ncbi:MAG: TIGR00341 family protein [Methanotrichaceae archaeon]|nr:TIGR00341 family protein [Methanotrichaceae archaeon]